jgi:para-nitrobenzyl esterase
MLTIIGSLFKRCFDTQTTVWRSGMLLGLLSFSAIAEQPKSKVDERPIASVASGQLRGVQDGSGAVFKGIPYARPPVGDLRWREPQPPAPWSGTRDAALPGAPCPQGTALLANFIGPIARSYGATYVEETIAPAEDCLYLNLWTPAWAPPMSLPVMVWLHGGSNMSGTGSQDIYDGKTLTKYGVIVVTINYRLGVLGFFSHPQLTAESPHHSSGNYGLLDQLAALKWVQENIAQFGGDPKNVTLFGESAGAIDAGVLMTSPLAAGLFERVISESGPAFGLGLARTLAEGESFGSAVGARAAPGSPGDQLSALRHMSPEALTQLALDVIKKEGKGDITSAVVDGWFLPVSPAKAFGLEHQQKVGLLIGHNGRELSAFRVSAAERKDKDKDKEDKDKAAPGPGGKDMFKQLTATIRPLYGNWTDLAIALYAGKALFGKVAAIDQASNDLLISCPAGAMASLTVDAGQPTFVYQFLRSIPGKGEADLGSFHSLELPYIFDAFQDHTWSWLPVTDVDHSLSATMQAYWTNFAKKGDPNAPGLPPWPSWDRSKEGYMEFGKDGKVGSRKDFSPPFCHLSPGRLREQLGAS